jgi:hypothetical protein
MLDIIEELKSLLAELARLDIDYALCGGLAMGVYGHTRATIDIDLLILSESLDKVIEIAKTHGYNIRGKDMSFAQGAVEIRRVSKIDPTDRDLLSLDLLLVTPEIWSVWDTRTEGIWEGGKLSVVSRAGLIALKQFRGSGRDLDDIKDLESDLHAEG